MRLCMHYVRAHYCGSQKLFVRMYDNELVAIWNLGNWYVHSKLRFFRSDQVSDDMRAGGGEVRVEKDQGCVTVTQMRRRDLEKCETETQRGQRRDEGPLGSFLTGASYRER